MKMALQIALVILSVIIIISILLQPSKSEGINSLISGGNENYFAKNKVRTREVTLARVTIVSSALFALVVIAMNMIK